MATGRTEAKPKRAGIGVRSWRAKLRKEKSSKSLGGRLAPHIVAIARSRVDAVALGIADPMDTGPVSPDAGTGFDAMRDDTVRETIRRRWRSEQPFQGMSTESIVRKLRSNVLTPQAASLANCELTRRGHKSEST